MDLDQGLPRRACPPSELGKKGFTGNEVGVFVVVVLVVVVVVVVVVVDAVVVVVVVVVAVGL